MGRRTAPEDDTAVACQRLDRWLWHARLARTRTTAARLVEDGHVRINAVRVTTSARPVRSGDVLTVALGHDVRVLRVRAFAERRGPAEEARQLYDPVEA